MKDHLNDIKRREHFRPVVPICLEDRAPEIFSPGTPDPYMLFDHQTRANWRDKIPAVVHLDGSARLQTISRNSPHKIAALLIEFEQLTGIPLLCTTSANLHGRGFFPDAGGGMPMGARRACVVRGHALEQNGHQEVIAYGTTSVSLR
ncbi:putative NodU family carbamoyl transferase [Bradyrhizobium diazoefficiens]